MNAKYNDIDQDWLKQFFSSKNLLKWEDICDESADPDRLDQVSLWLEHIINSGHEFAVVLPLYKSENDICWYGVATNGHLFSQLIDDLASFVGRTYTDFMGITSQLKSASKYEKALIRKFDNRVLKFSAFSSDDTDEVKDLLKAYCKLLVRRPDIPDRTHRPFGTIRRDFDLALLAGSEVSAKKFLYELVESGRVNAEQKRCLIIRKLAGLGHYDEIARDHSLISSMVDITLPPQTLSDLVSALYVTFILSIERLPAPEVVGTFKQSIGSRYGGLFGKLKGISSPTVLKSFFLSELCQAEPNVERCNAILSKFQSSSEDALLVKEWIKALPVEKPSPPEVITSDSGLELARQAIADEDYENALRICFDLAPQYWVFSAMLRCAFELRSKEISQDVLERINNGPKDIRDEFKDRDHRRISSLTEYLTLEPPAKVNNWIDWLEGVNAKSISGNPIEVLLQQIDKWSVEDYVNDFSRCNKIAELIGSAPPEIEKIYRDAFPQIVDFFISPEGTYHSLRPIYSILVKILAWNDALSVDELEIAYIILNVFLVSGPSKIEYQECLEDYQEIISNNKAFHHLDWALNSSEMLALYPNQDEGKLRLEIFIEVCSIALSATHRLTRTQREIFQTLAQDYNYLDFLDSIPEETDLAEPADALAYDGFIGIYTLMEGAGQRAKEILSKRFPNSKIETNNDFVKTDRLTSIAKNADIFVFAWKASKHSAYFGVKDVRKKQDILMPTGKGAASIVQVVLDAIVNQH